MHSLKQTEKLHHTLASHYTLDSLSSRHTFLTRTVEETRDSQTPSYRRMFEYCARTNYLCATIVTSIRGLLAQVPYHLG